MIKVSVIHTGKVYVSPALPFKDKIKNPNPLQLSLLSLYERRNRIWLPVSAYFDGEKFVLLFADGGYAEKSWREEIPPGTALDENLALKSLQWIAKVSKIPACIESLANHDPNITPHEIII